MNGRTVQRKGDTWEVDCRDFLTDEYPYVKRNGNLYGKNDRGDLAEVPDWTLQCKNVQRDEWASWFEETQRQSVNNSTRWWAVIRKARRRGTGEAIFAMSFTKGKELMTYLRDLEEENRQLKERIKELISD